MRLRQAPFLGASAVLFFIYVLVVFTIFDGACSCLAVQVVRGCVPCRVVVTLGARLVGAEFARRFSDESLVIGLVVCNGVARGSTCITKA